MEINYILDDEDLPELEDTCVCRKCNISKPISEFYHYRYKSQNKKLPNLEYTKPIKVCKECKRKESLEKVEYNLWARAKARSIKNNIPFNIDIEDIVVPALCPILGIEIRVNKNSIGKNSIALDKIIPELGYTKGNVQVISMLANSMKSNANKNELLAFANWILTAFQQNEQDCSKIIGNPE